MGNGTLCNRRPAKKGNLLVHHGHLAVTKDLFFILSYRMVSKEQWADKFMVHVTVDTVLISIVQCSIAVYM